VAAPVFWVEHQSDWYKHLKFLINNKNARLDYGEKIYEWANKKYHLKDINIGRKSTFENLRPNRIYKTGNFKDGFANPDLR
jgi:hypothetical protein